MDTDKQVIKELVAIKKLLMAQLRAQGFSPSAIGKVLGVTTGAQVRQLVPDVKVPQKGKGRQE